MRHAVASLGARPFLKSTQANDEIPWASVERVRKATVTEDTLLDLAAIVTRVFGGKQRRRQLLLVRGRNGRSGRLLLIDLLGRAPLLHLLLPRLVSVRGDDVSQPDRLLVAVAGKAHRGVLVTLGVGLDLYYLSFIFDLLVEGAASETCQKEDSDDRRGGKILPTLLACYLPRRRLTPNKYVMG